MLWILQLDDVKKRLVPGDPTVKRLVELYKKLEDAAKEGSAIKGWHPLRFNSKGWVVAGKRDADGI